MQHAALTFPARTQDGASRVGRVLTKSVAGERVFGGCAAPRTCVLGGDGCISSSGYPSSNYPDNDACTISVDSSNTRLIDVVAFSTENNYDKLWVNGIAYDGTSTSDGPAGIVPTQDIVWDSVS